MALKDQLELKEFVCFALYSASRSMTQLYRCYLDRHGLTYPQFLALFTLWKQDGMTVREIGETLMLDGGTVTPLLKRLESKGLIRRERTVEDERVVRVFVTDQGAELEGLLEEVAGGLMCDIGMSPDEVKTMATTLHRLRETIETSSARYKD